MKQNTRLPIINYRYLGTDGFLQGSGAAIASMTLGVSSAVLILFSCLAIPIAGMGILLGISILSHFRMMNRASICMATTGVGAGTLTCVFYFCYVFIYFFQSASAGPLMPQGFKSPTFYSTPNLTKEEEHWLVTQGVYTNGHLHWLRVTFVAPNSQLATAYGLHAGDIITSYNQSQISDIDDIKVVTMRVIASSKYNAKYKVLRNGKSLFLTDGHPPVDAHPDE